MYPSESFEYAECDMIPTDFEECIEYESDSYSLGFSRILQDAVQSYWSFKDVEYIACVRM